MPANLPPQYFAAEKEYKNAKSAPEKIAALEAMLAIMPHHKGTDKLRASLNHKIAQLRDQEETSARTKRGSVFSVERQGAAQVLLVGAPNAGKSSLLASLTHARPHIADYPFTTTQPEIGMMPYEDIQIQIVDLPPLAGEVRKLPYYNLLRTADALLLVVDGGGDVVSGVRAILAELAEGKIHSPLDDDAALEIGAVRRSMMVVVNKCDRPGGGEAVGALSAAFGPRLEAVAVSAAEKRGLEEMRQAVYRVLRIVRVYTKVPGRKTDSGAPFVLPEGSTVMDLARSIHRDFAENLRFARIWGSGRFDGQPVERDHVLRDRDVIELHL